MEAVTTELSEALELLRRAAEVIEMDMRDDLTVAADEAEAAVAILRRVEDES